jgi:hypothetical protein
MDPATLNGIAQIVVPSLAIIVFGACGLICFPSIRAAMAERLRLRALRHADATEVMSTLNALRGEVYALRTEVAEVRRAVGAGSSSQSPALPPGSAQSAM